MGNFDTCWKSLDETSVDFNELFTHLEQLLLSLARKRAPYDIIPYDILDMEIDEIIQNSRIKVWHFLQVQKGTITNLRAFVERIVYHESVNVARYYRRTGSLTLTEDGETPIGTLLMHSNPAEPDPASDFEQQEEAMEIARQVSPDIADSPPHQQHAMLCDLKDKIGDIPFLVEVFQQDGLDIEAANWPAQALEKKRLYASLYPLRKRLRARWKTPPVN